MAKTLSIRTTVTDGNGNSIANESVSYSSGLLTLIDGEAIAGSATTALTIALDVSAVKAFCIVSTVAVTLKTNETGSPAHTLVLRANEPYTWHTNDYDTFKLATTDITSMHFVVAGATAGTVTVAALIDPTP